MIYVTLLCIGKIKKEYFELQKGYSSMLSPFVKLKFVEIQEISSSNFNALQIIDAESNLIANKLSKMDGVKILFDKNGLSIDSNNLFEIIYKGSINAGKFVFIIGGSFGLNAIVSRLCNKVVSLGKITLPHSLARVILLEQLYRAACINSGKIYHK